jgi:cytoskeletal protein RodZ
MSSNTINREASFPQMIGARLEKVRNTKGFAHVAEVASLVKIPESIIEDIESGNIEEHLQETYNL